MDPAEETHEACQGADPYSASSQQIKTENMEEKVSEENGQVLSTPKEEEEEMEVTGASDYTETPAEAQVKTEPDAEMGVTHTHSTVGMQSEVNAWTEPIDCKTEDEDDDSDSDSSSSSSSTSSSSTSSSSPSAPVHDNDDDDEGFSQSAPVKTRDEVLLEDLPAVEDLSVSLPEEAELQPVGTVSRVMQQLVIIQSLRDMPPLTDDSILFTSERQAVGKVFEVFGPVCSPFYILRFNSPEQISKKGLTPGVTVYFAPNIKEYTGYILTQQLKLMKGSDASWKNDQEPPPEALDYSDDEKEQEAKRNTRKKKNSSNPDKPSQNALPQHRDGRGFPLRRSGASFRPQNPRNQPPPFHRTPPPPPPPSHQHVSPAYLPPPCPYPPPPPHHFPLPSFPLYTSPPPSFFNPAFSPPLWPPNSIPYSNLPPPPPPPPPPPHPPQ